MQNASKGAYYKASVLLPSLKVKFLKYALYFCSCDCVQYLLNELYSKTGLLSEDQAKKLIQHRYLLSLVLRF